MTVTAQKDVPPPPYAKTLPALLEHHAREHASRIALVDGARQMSFSELHRRASSLAHGLERLGVGRGDVVALWLPSSMSWVEAAFAAAYRGAVVFGVNTRLGSHDVRTALVDSRASVLVVRPDFRGIDFLGMLGEIADDLPTGLQHVVTVGTFTEVPRGLSARTVAYESLLVEGPAAQSLATPDLPAQAFSSSGTTSAPKLVLQTHAALVGHSHAVAWRFGYFSQDTVVLGALPFCGVFGYNTLLATLAAGRPLIVQAAFQAEESVRLMKQHSVTHTNLSDEMLRRILDCGALEELPTWREAAFGNFTAIDPEDLVGPAVGAGKRFFQTYGSSELQALMCYPADGAGPERWTVGGGVPVSAKIRVRVRDPESRALLAEGERGEVEVAGPNVTCGYLNRDGIADLTDDGYFRTGDVGYLAPGGDLVYLSRSGDALRLGGFLVSPREIEEFLEQDPTIREAQIVGVETDTGAGVVGFVLVAPRAVFDEEASLERCRDELARFKVPRRLVPVDSYPMSAGANGNKIQRSKLRELAQDLLSREEVG